MIKSTTSGGELQEGDNNPSEGPNNLPASSFRAVPPEGRRWPCAAATIPWDGIKEIPLMA